MGGFTHPSRQEDDGDDGCDRCWEEPSEGPEPTPRLWQYPELPRGLPASSGVRLLAPSFFLLAQQSTLENDSRIPLVIVTAAKKYRNPTLACGSSGCHMSLF
ncbi:MAG: hypothetical protein ACLP0B_04900 [Steroidobacteraceae bacterium]|jgi:hypothetical protein